MPYQLSEDLIQYMQHHMDTLVELIKTLCRIPAPSNQEEKRSEFILDWLLEAGAKGAYIDEALNVVFPYGDTGGNGPLTIMMAHIDTVFPDLDPFEVTILGNRMKCPGVGDDTTNVALMLMIIKFLLATNQKPKEGIIFVADAGEEGLGNLKGCRQIMKVYGNRVKEFISFDGSYTEICNHAVGSRRYQVTVRTEGGHSYGAFGNQNAIHLMSSMIDTLYTLKVPSGGKSTYNVGLMSGGTSVNTIAQEATMLFEYRSDIHKNLNMMDTFFHKTVDSYRAMGIKIEVELVGDRPCMGNVNPESQAQLEAKVINIMKALTGWEIKKRSGSTDCNIPFSMGIPSICFGGYIGYGAHTREEYIEISSLKTGFKIMAAFIMEYIK